MFFNLLIYSFSTLFCAFSTINTLILSFSLSDLYLFKNLLLALLVVSFSISALAYVLGDNSHSDDSEYTLLIVSTFSVLSCLFFASLTSIYPLKLLTADTICSLDNSECRQVDKIEADHIFFKNGSKISFDEFAKNYVITKESKDLKASLNEALEIEKKYKNKYTDSLVFAFFIILIFIASIALFFRALRNRYTIVFNTSLNRACQNFESTHIFYYLLVSIFSFVYFFFSSEILFSKQPLITFSFSVILALLFFIGVYLIDSRNTQINLSSSIASIIVACSLMFNAAYLVNRYSISSKKKDPYIEVLGKKMYLKLDKNYASENYVKTLDQKLIPKKYVKYSHTFHIDENYRTDLRKYLNISSILVFLALLASLFIEIRNEPSQSSRQTRQRLKEDLKETNINNTQNKNIIEEKTDEEFSRKIIL